MDEFMAERAIRRWDQLEVSHRQHDFEGYILSLVTSSLAHAFSAFQLPWDKHFSSTIPFSEDISAWPAGLKQEAKWPWTETSKTIFPPLTCVYLIFCLSNGKLTNIGSFLFLAFLLYLLIESFLLRRVYLLLHLFICPIIYLCDYEFINFLSCLSYTLI